MKRTLGDLIIFTVIPQNKQIDKMNTIIVQFKIYNSKKER
jgi:hypothetical protein